MTRRVPGQGRYAHLEREQRWLVSSPPLDAVLVASIVDRYLDGTRLRLRRAETDGVVVHKLGQKVRVEPDDPERVQLTNIYLSAGEYDALAVLPAAELSKTRTRVAWHDHVVAVDRFSGRLDGLVLAEVELTSSEPLLPTPPWAIRDVTNDDRFSGGALAHATDEEIQAILR